MSPIKIILMILLMIVLIYLSGWFSGSETAITKLNVTDIADLEDKKKKVKYVKKLKGNMDRTLITILIGNNVVNILLSSIAALFANSLFNAVGVSIVIGIITFLIIVFGEITPKSKAVKWTNRIAITNSKFIFWLSVFLYPIVKMFVFISRHLTRKADEKSKGLLVTDQKIKNLATFSEKEGGIKRIEKDIIHKVFVFGDKKVREIVVPIERVFTLRINYSVQEARKIAAQKGFTRIPIVDEKNDIIGIINSKDLLWCDKKNIRAIVREPFIVDSDIDITDLFNQMRKKRNHIAVVENHVKQLGIVTLEDIIEELVGNIQDEYFNQKFIVSEQE